MRRTILAVAGAAVLATTTACGGGAADETADGVKRLQLILVCSRRCRDADGGKHHHCRVAERKEEADRERTPALLHQLARDVVDCRNVIGIDRVAQPKAVSKEGSAQKHRIILERQPRPRPGGDIGDD